jgi:hypothetical protein
MPEYEVDISMVRKFGIRLVLISKLVWRLRGGLYVRVVRGGTFHVFCEFYDVGLGMTGSEVKRGGFKDMSF